MLDASAECHMYVSNGLAWWLDQHMCACELICMAYRATLQHAMPWGMVHLTRLPDAY